MFNKYNIRVGIDLIFGWPGETIEEGLDTLKLAKMANVDRFNCNVMVYFPDAAITRYAYEKGFLDKFPDVFEIDKYYITLAAMNSLYKQKKINEEKINEVISKYKIDSEKINPLKC